MAVADRRLPELGLVRDVRAGYDRIESGRTVGKLSIDVASTRDPELTEATKEGEPRP